MQLMYTKLSNIQEILFHFFLNIDENMKLDKKNLRGYTYKITYILVFNCPRVAKFVLDKTALSSLSC